LRNLIICFLTFFHLICIASGISVGDSLRLSIKNGEQTASKLNDYAEYLQQQNNEEYFDFAKQALEKSDVEKNPEQEIRSMIIIADYLNQQNQLSEAEKYLLKCISIQAKGKVKAKAYLSISRFYYSKGEFLKSIFYIEQAKIESNLNSHETSFDFYCLEGKNRLAMDDMEGVQSCINQAGQLLIDIKNPLSRASYFNLTGNYQLLKNDFYNAFSSLIKATRELQGNIHTSEYGQSLLGIAKIYQLRKNYILALANSEEALLIFTKTGSTIGKIESLGQIAEIELEQNQTEHAFKIIEKAINLSEGIDVQYLKARSYQEMAKYCLTINQLADALKYSQQALDYCSSEADFHLKFQIYSLLGDIYLKNNQTDSSLYFIQKATGFCSIPGYWQDYKTTCQQLSEVFFKKGDYKSASDYGRVAMSYSDSLSIKLSQIDLVRLEKNQESLRQNNRISFLTNENLEQEDTIRRSTATISKQKFFIILSSIFLIFVLGFLILLGILLRQRRRSNKFLEATNRQIAQQNEEIESQRQYLAEANQELEKLSLIAKETDNAIRIMDSTGKIMWINEGYTRLHGYTIEDLQKDTGLFIKSEKNPLDVNKMVNIWFGDKKPISFEAEVTTKDHRKIWIQTTLTPLVNSQQKLDKLIAIDADITALKQAEHEIMAMNEDITASITYAKRIQEAMMTPISFLTSHFPNSFCLHLPKSIVSGDFYWFTYQYNRLIVVCADSTGHGVPGAFMSLIGISFLNKIINEKGFVSPAVILNRLRMNIIDHLHQADNNMAAGDGMDMSIISIDKNSKTLEYAGAMNPMYILRKGDIIELKPDRMPVGFYDNEDRPFSSTSISLKNNDQLYLFTDGYYDQFGGPGGSKLKATSFKDILKGCEFKDAKTQKEILHNAFIDWKGKTNQVDDVLVLGINID
jgi:PAS domain S-box-containing protein